MRGGVPRIRARGSRGGVLLFWGGVSWPFAPPRRGSVQQLMQSYQRLPGNALLRGFRVSYKRHVLTMDDLQTLYGPNWLNDQVGGGGKGGLRSGGAPRYWGGGL